jgi:hypothetical protein
MVTDIDIDGSTARATVEFESRDETRSRNLRVAKPAGDSWRVAFSSD